MIQYKKTFNDLIHEYFTLEVSVISWTSLHNNEYNLAFFKDNYDSDDSDEFDDCETFFPTESKPFYKNTQFSD